MYTWVCSIREQSKKEAMELRKLGVKIPDNRILEYKEVFINENLESYFSIFIIVHEKHEQ